MICTEAQFALGLASEMDREPTVRCSSKEPASPNDQTTAHAPPRTLSSDPIRRTTPQCAKEQWDAETLNGATARTAGREIIRGTMQKMAMQINMKGQSGSSNKAITITAAEENHQAMP